MIEIAVTVGVEPIASTFAIRSMIDRFQVIIVTETGMRLRGHVTQSTHGAGVQRPCCKGAHG
jgi:hypothetical protein